MSSEIARMQAKYAGIAIALALLTHFPLAVFAAGDPDIHCGAEYQFPPKSMPDLALTLCGFSSLLNSIEVGSQVEVNQN